MTITVQNLSSFALNFIEVIDDHRIVLTSDLEKLMGKDVKTKDEASISFTNRPSNQGIDIPVDSVTKKREWIDSDTSRIFLSKSK